MPAPARVLIDAAMGRQPDSDIVSGIAIFIGFSASGRVGRGSAAVDIQWVISKIRRGLGSRQPSAVVR